MLYVRSAKQTVQNTVPGDWEEEETKCSSASVPLNGTCAGTPDMILEVGLGRTIRRRIFPGWATAKRACSEVSADS